MEHIGEFFNIANPEFFNFRIGYLTGTIVALAAILLFIVIKIAVYYLLFYPRRAKGVLIQGENGSLFISSGAITDMVKTLERNFKVISIRKVLLLDKKKFNDLEVHIDFDMNEQDLPTITMEFQNTIIQTLKDNFGIDRIREVNIKVKRVTMHGPGRF